jgi:multimeric flavodoxin WrbA
MQIVALCGSPRRGNTDALLNALAEGALEAGAGVTRFDLPKLDLKPCRACRACLKTPEARCIQRDDMIQVLDALREADAWVLATPVYFWSVSGPMKLAIDRFFSFFTEQGGWQLALPGERRGAVLVVQADPDQEVPDKVAGYLESVLEYHNVKVIGRIAAASLGGPGDAAGRPELLEEARGLGRELARAS